MRQLEPLTELLSSRIDWRYKMMRLVARASFARQNFGPEWDAEDRQLDAFGASVNDIVSQLETEGYSGTFTLAAEAVRAIRTDLEGAQFVNRRYRSDKRQFNFDRLENDGVSAIYSNFSMHEDSPVLKRLIASNIEPVAKAYLGNRCRFLNSQVWITFPGTTPVQNKDFGWHYDVDDYKFLKFFCYLNDVDDTTGPHAIIPASHKSRYLYRFFNRQLDDKSAEHFGKHLVLTGLTGTCFFEDTIIYHKGLAPTERPRVILQVQFGVTM